MPEIEKSAGSVEEAIEAALAELGVSEQEATIQIVQEERSGFLGRGGQPAIVRVRTEARAPARDVVGEPTDDSALDDGRVDDATVDEQAEIAEAFVQGLLDSMGVDFEVEINVSEGVSYVDIWGAEGSDEIGILIGRRGHTVDSLQELVRSHVQHRTGERCRVQVDVEDYRKRQRSRIVRQAREVARRVTKTGRTESLEPMNAYERKLVHDAVGEFNGLETVSEGEDPERFVVVRRRR